jgi:hypothetical protein
MSKYGYTGSKKVRTLVKGDNFDPEAGPELEEIKARNNRYNKAQNQNTDARFGGGPVFRRITPPKRHFINKYGKQIGGFMIVSMTFFYVISPLYQ